jgi:hypothetical protein
MCAPAQACRGPGLHQSVLFKDTTNLKAPIIVRLTVTDVDKGLAPRPAPHLTAEALRYRFFIIGTAHIEQVLKGELAAPSVRVAVAPDSCGPYLYTGMFGIMAGTLTRDTQGIPVLMLISESEYTRQDRLRAAGLSR